MFVTEQGVPVRGNLVWKNTPTALCKKLKTAMFSQVAISFVYSLRFLFSRRRQPINLRMSLDFVAILDR
jgi:hypothetical protein